MDEIRFLTKVEVHGGSQPLYGFLQIVEDENIVTPDEIGLNTEAFEQLNLPEGTIVTLSLTPPPPSLNSIKRKIAGNILSPAEYNNIINDIINKRYSNMDVASFLVASGAFMTPQEVLSFTQALIGNNTINWDNESIVVVHHGDAALVGKFFESPQLLLQKLNCKIGLLAANHTAIVMLDSKKQSSFNHLARNATLVHSLIHMLGRSHIATS